MEVANALLVNNAKTANRYFKNVGELAKKLWSRF